MMLGSKNALCISECLSDRCLTHVFQKAPHIFTLLGIAHDCWTLHILRSSGRVDVHGGYRAEGLHLQDPYRQHYPI